jgi:cell division cycle 2-like protein
MVMEYVDHDLKTLISDPKVKLTISEIKCLMIQLLHGIKYMHENWVMHRDLKTTNLLLSENGTLKICDFGMAREFGDPIRPYTQVVITLWYRPPEILLGETKYTTSADMWGIGCIFAELLTREALFPGKTEIEQIQIIFNIMGVPTEQSWKGYSLLPHVQRFNFFGPNISKLKDRFSRILSDEGLKMLSGLLAMDPKKRWTAQQALDCKYFKESPYPQNKDLMRTFPKTYQ